MLKTVFVMLGSAVGIVVQLAAFRELRVVGSDQYLGYDRVYVECMFEKGSVVFRMAFNSDKQMTGAGWLRWRLCPVDRTVRIRLVLELESSFRRNRS